ncbi:MAG: response regulator, partial [Bdellovibrionales bacterium]|nr:response regulator [Bdellovibrionales bacterium]
MKNQILFVDDEANLLSGLQRLLRPLRADWDMEFVLGGRQALERIHQNCFDVVVTDMKMPEIDGSHVLKEVKEICPFSVRMVLSGQAENDALLRAIRYTHQYFSKPCEPELLQKKIHLACRARDLLSNLELKELAAGLDTLPALQENIVSLHHLLQQEEFNLENAINIIERDIAMSAKVLQLTSTDFFGKAQKDPN